MHKSTEKPAHNLSVKVNLKSITFSPFYLLKSYISSTSFTIGAQALYNTLQSEFFGSYHICCMSSRICCMSFCNQNCLLLSHTLHELSHLLHEFLWSHQVFSKSWTCTLFRHDWIQSKLLQSNAGTLVRMFYNILCTFKINAWCLKINCSCLCVCYATMRLLLNMPHVILQSFTINAKFIGLRFHALPLEYTGYRIIFALCYFHFYLRFCLILN